MQRDYTSGYTPRNLYLGIDPGTNGGMALIDDEGVLETWHMPDTERKVWNTIFGITVHLHQHVPIGSDTPADRGVRIYCLMEKVGGYIPGSKGNIGSAMFTFGHSYGGLRMALVAASIPFEVMMPSVWQKAIGIIPRGMKSKVSHKGELKKAACYHFPEIKITLSTADALLLAYCCRLRNKNKQ